MEFLIVLVFVLVTVALFVRTGKLDARVRHIERYLQEHTAALGHAPTTASVAHVASPPEGEPMTPEEMLRAPASAPLPPLVRSEPDPLERFAAWCKEDWLMKLGGLLIILGMAWFVSYAMMRGWIGENGRIFLGLLTGAGVLTLGRYRMQQFVAQGSTLMFIGATIIILTLFAARELYEMFTPLSVLALMFGTSALLGVTSIVFRRESLAYGNVLLAALAPLLINSPELPLTTLFPYLLVLSVGAVGVAIITGWRNLPFVSLIIVGLYSLSYIGSYRHRGDLDVGLMYAFIFTGLFFAVSILAMRVRRELSVVDLLTALGSGTFLLLWILAGGKAEWHSLLLVAWTLVFAFGAFLAVRLGASVAYFYSYAGVGVVYIGIATAIELEEGSMLVIAAILEAALVLWLGYRITGDTRHIPVLALPSVVPTVLTFESMGAREWRNSIVHGDSFALLLYIFVAISLGFLFYNERMRLDEAGRARVKSVARALWIIAGIYSTIYAWLVCHALFVGDAATMVVLVLYAVVAVVFYNMHRASGVHWQRVVANLYTAFVAGWLLLVEQWTMDVPERVATFLLVGVALAAVSWVERSARRATPPAESALPDNHHSI